MHVSNSTTNSAIVGIYKLLIFTFIFSTLYIAQAIVIPLTIAALLTFLLSPLVSYLEKYLGRVLSILTVVLVVFSLIGIAVFVFARQFILFGSKFPAYSENIKLKFQGFKLPDWDIFNRMSLLFNSFTDLLFGDSTKTTAQASNAEFKLLDLGSNFINFIGSFFGSFFNILMLIGIVLLLVMFMLLNREDIRSRIVKLMGLNKISSTTLALDDASDRVFTYLYRLFVVNVCFGISVTLGLIIIGVPNPVLWGCFATVLRFVPYIGSWIAAIIPIILSFVITDSWMTPVLTIFFFVALELLTAYVVEPFYYGRGTGVSSFALILAAIFWTWLWGPIGLLLSTPLTVCLVVMGKHVTNMQFLDVLLSQEAPLNELEECYHHLLSFEPGERIDLIEDYLENNSQVSLYDSLLIPIITKTENDYHHELIDSDKKAQVFQGIYEIIDSLKNENQEVTFSGNKKMILCIPAHSARDEMAAKILQETFPKELYHVVVCPKLSESELLNYLEKNDPDIVCINAISPFLPNHIYQLMFHLRHTKHHPLVISFWGSKEINPKTIDQLNKLGASKISFTLAQTIETILAI